MVILLYAIETWLRLIRCYSYNQIHHLFSSSHYPSQHHHLPLVNLVMIPLFRPFYFYIDLLNIIHEQNKWSIAHTTQAYLHFMIIMILSNTTLPITETTRMTAVMSTCMVTWWWDMFTYQLMLGDIADTDVLGWWCHSALSLYRPSTFTVSYTLQYWSTYLQWLFYSVDHEYNWDL